MKEVMLWPCWLLAACQRRNPTDERTDARAVEDVQVAVKATCGRLSSESGKAMRYAMGGLRGVWRVEVPARR